MTYRDALADMSTDELVRLDGTLSDIFRELVNIQGRLENYGFPRTGDLLLHIRINDAKREINILKAEINNEAMKGVRV